MPVQHWVITHKTCGGPAFLYAVEPVAGECIKRAFVLRLDGWSVQRSGPVICGSCGQIVNGAADIAPGGSLPPMYDMSSTEDMEMLYAHG